MAKITKVNRTGNGHQNRYLFGFEGYSAFFLVWGEDLADAIDWLGEYCRTQAPGLTCTAEVDAAFKQALADGKTPEEAWNKSDENGQFLAGDSGQYFDHTLICVCENPPKATLQYFLEG